MLSADVSGAATCRAACASMHTACLPACQATSFSQHFLSDLQGVIHTIQQSANMEQLGRFPEHASKLRIMVLTESLSSVNNLYAALGTAVLGWGHLVVILIVPRRLEANAVIVEPVIAMVT